MVQISEILNGLVYKVYEKKLQKKVKSKPIPNHVAVIMDGNRRFAKELRLSSLNGHEKGRDKLEELLSWCLELDIKILTVYAFSTENLTRERKEKNDLFKLFERNFYTLGNDERVHKFRIKITVLGQRELLPEKVLKAIKYAEEKTKNYTNYFFNLALAYGSREEITRAVKDIAKDVKCGKIKSEAITEDMVSSYLYTKDFPDPNLILRTSGEERISNFLLWQLAYSELYFLDVYWPKFRKIDFLRAIWGYQQRVSRMGK